MRAVASTETTPIEVVRKEGTGRRTDYIGSPGLIDANPQAFLVDRLYPGATIDPHFHDIDQFQVVVAGDCAMGKKAATPVTGSAAPAEDTRFVYDGAEAIADTDASGTVLRRYVYGSGIDDPVAVYLGAGTGASDRRYYATDYQGSVVALVDDNGAAIEQHAYSALGRPETTGLGASGQPLRYTARRLDAETGLYYYRARAYSPSLGALPAARPDRLRRRAEPLRLCRQRSGELCRS